MRRAHALALDWQKLHGLFLHARSVMLRPTSSLRFGDPLTPRLRARSRRHATVVGAAAAGAHSLPAAGMTGTRLCSASVRALRLALGLGFLAAFELDAPASIAAQSDAVSRILTGVVLGEFAGNFAVDLIVQVIHCKTP